MSAAVVYVDDEPKICRVFELNLKIRKIDVATFTDPLEAIDYINENDDVCVVFSDYRMPRMTGGELLESLKRDVPFYIVTGGTGAFDDPRLIDRVRVLPKPIDYDEVLRLVEESTPC